MGTGEDDPNKNEWPTQTDLHAVTTDSSSVFRYPKELDDKEVSPRGHAQWANDFRDNYMQTGDAESLGRALHHYDLALDSIKHEPLLEAWVLCNRLNIYLHDLGSGRVMLADVEEQLDAAYSVAAGAKTVRDAEFRTQTMRWIESTREQIMPTPMTSEDTQEYSFPALRLVGGTAIEGVNGLDSAPEPGAA